MKVKEARWNRNRDFLLIIQWVAECSFCFSTEVRDPELKAYEVFKRYGRACFCVAMKRPIHIHIEGLNL